MAEETFKAAVPRAFCAAGERGRWTGSARKSSDSEENAQATTERGKASGCGLRLVGLAPKSVRATRTKPDPALSLSSLLLVFQQEGRLTSEAAAGTSLLPSARPSRPLRLLGADRRHSRCVRGCRSPRARTATPTLASQSRLVAFPSEDCR